MEWTPEILALGVLWYVAFLFSTTLHEAAHAFAAYRLGDPTAYLGGQVTLNPVPHVQREPFGMVLVPILTYALSGWTMGWASAPYDPSWAQRYPRCAAMMALAGPAANFLVVLVSGIVLRVGLAAGIFSLPSGPFSLARLVVADGGTAAGLAAFLSILFTLNLILFAFNLLPLPPLDGSAVLQALLPPSAARSWQELMMQPMFSLLGIVIAWRVFGYFFAPIFRIARSLLYAGAG